MNYFASLENFMCQGRTVGRRGDKMTGYLVVKQKTWSNIWPCMRTRE